MVLLAIVLAGLLVQSDRVRLTPEGPASVEGVVVRAGTNQPISGATLELTGVAPRTVEGGSNVGRGVISVSVRESESDGRVLSFTTTTNSDGTFQIDNLPPASNYQLVAIHLPEYLPGQFGQRVPSLPGRAISLTPGERMRGLKIEMTPAATVFGVVVDSRGQPVRNVPVELRRPWYLEGWRVLVDWNQLIDRVRGVGKSNRAARSTTNARGEFTFSGLAPAQYYIRTNFTDEEKAQPINLHAGEVIHDVRIVAPDSGRRIIRGTISGGRSTARIRVFRRSVPLYGGNQIAEVEANGQFAVAVPGPGPYVLVAQQNDFGLARFGRKEVEVADFDPYDVRLDLVPSFSLPSRVTFEGDPPAADLEGVSMSLTLYPTANGTTRVPPVRLPLESARFTIDDVTVGDYRVDVFPILMTPPHPFLLSNLERAFVKSVRMDGKDILAEGLHLDSVPGGSLDIVISMNGGTLTGMALDAAGKPVPNVKAVLVPNSPRRARGDLYKYVSTDDSGRYQFNGLAPGEYKVFAWERVEEGAWQDPQYLRLFENQGVPVRINEGARQTADAKLIPAWN